MKGFVFQVILKAPEEFADFMGKIFDGCEISCCLSDFFSKFKAVLDIGKGAPANVNKKYKLFFAFSGVALHYVRNRNSCAVQLTGESEDLMTWKRFGYFINGNCQVRDLFAKR
jgi:hypothetical protein